VISRGTLSNPVLDALQSHKTVLGSAGACSQDGIIEGTDFTFIKEKANIYIQVRYSYFMEITKLSTKGQIVIPESLRKGFDSGTPFVVSRQDNLIILKEVKGMTNEEQAELEELDKVWKEIDNGKCESYTEKDFFAKMKEW
jgi:bifunctional DNA-binding transcriptional regulator/antitoxin component of YhaV-PrlF toxin-antitoxin module